jgi:uncharacterized protein
MSFVCLLEIHLHFPENGSLKGKRKELTSVKAQLQRRFGAAVSEVDHHDLWQRATLSAALVGTEAGRVSDASAALERYLHSRFPDGVRIERALASADELLGDG